MNNGDMKKFFVVVLAFFAISAANAQNNEDMRYLKKGAVSVEHGRVVFKDSISIVQGYTPEQMTAVARGWMEKFLEEKGNRKNQVISDRDNRIMATAQMEIVFTKNALSYDKAIMNFVLTINSTSENCVLKIDRIKYNYDDGSGYESILAEDYITDEQAVNKKGTRLYPITGKFRRKTIDAADEIFASFKEGLKYYSREGMAEVVKNAPHVMMAGAAPQAATQAAPQTAPQTPVEVQKPLVVEKVQHGDLEGFAKISPEDIQGNAIKMIGKGWMLITAGNSEKFNMMTASWGGFGVLYNKPVAICFINPARYTYGIMENNDTYTLTFYSEDYRKALEYCGSKSGRDEDKVKGSGLTPVGTENGAMAFKEAKIIIECRKLVSQSISLDAINNTQEREKRAMQPMHKMYIGEILNVWVK